MNVFAFANVTSVPSSPVLLRGASLWTRYAPLDAELLGARPELLATLLAAALTLAHWCSTAATGAEAGGSISPPRPVPRRTNSTTPAEAVLEKAGEDTARERARKSGLGEGPARASPPPPPPPPRKVSAVENAASRAQGFRGRPARSGSVHEERARGSGSPSRAGDARAADAGLALPASGSVYEQLFGTGSGGQTWEAVGGPVGLMQQLNDSFAGCVSGGAVIKTTVGPRMYVSLETSKVYIVPSGKSRAGRALMKTLVGLRHARTAAKGNEKRTMPVYGGEHMTGTRGSRDDRPTQSVI